MWSANRAAPHRDNLVVRREGEVNAMATVQDVANYMIGWRAMTAMKLQKLVYYSQAWHLAEYGKPLFRETIEAWANGPVVRELYDHHRGEYTVIRWPWGDQHELTDKERDSIDLVLRTYGAKDPQWLSDETHSEPPWQQAREGLPPGGRSSTPIAVGSMRDYYRARLRAGRGPEYASLRR